MHYDVDQLLKCNNVCSDSVHLYKPVTAKSLLSLPIIYIYV